MPPDTDFELSEEEWAAIYPEEFDDELPPPSKTPRSLDRLRQGIEPDDPEFHEEFPEEDEPYVHRSPTLNLGSLKRLPIDDYDPNEPWTSRTSDRSGREIE